MDVTNGLGDKINAAIDKLPGMEQAALDALKAEVGLILATERDVMAQLQPIADEVVDRMLKGIETVIAAERDAIFTKLDQRLGSLVPWSVPLVP